MMITVIPVLKIASRIKRFWFFSQPNTKYLVNITIENFIVIFIKETEKLNAVHFLSSNS